MKNVKIKKLKIENFRGIASLDFDFASDQVRVLGKNGSGKSTLYNAYLWCLFGKDGDGRSLDIQPLTETNEIVHKVVTAVTLLLDVNGNEVCVQRKQREDWSVPRGRTEEIFKGNVQERYFNDVPCGVSEFRDKLNEICNVDDWFMLSSISAFMGIEQKERRKKLTAIAGEVSEMQIAEPFPEVKKAFEQGKTIDELARQTRNSRSKAKQDLDEIPARIDQAKKMLVENINYSELEINIEEIERKIKEIDAEILKDVTDTKINKIDDLLKRKNELGNDLARITDQLKERRTKEFDTIQNNISKMQRKMVQNQENTVMLNSLINHEKTNVESFESEADVLKREWVEVNEKEFDTEIGTTCPLCGSNLPADQISEKRQTALEKFNQDKLARLAGIEKQFKVSKDYITTHKANIEKHKFAIEKNQAENNSLSTQINEERKKLDLFPTEEMVLNADANHKMIVGEMAVLNSEISALKESYEHNGNTETLKAKRAELQAELKQELAELQTRETNEKVYGMIDDLNTQSKTISQTIASLDKVEFEIQGFKKAKIECVEKSVSDLFGMVRWKMYEPNITNDGEKEICQAIINGKPYEQQNTATKVNAGIDIINGLSKAYGVQVPMFVDNKESVTELIETTSQLITLEVNAVENLTIKNS